MIIELGGNDGLRGFPVKTIQTNLSDMIDSVKKEKGKVLLSGMQMPPNFGSNYTHAFSRVYRTVAKKHQVILVFSENVADRADSSDGSGATGIVEQRLALSGTFAELKFQFSPGERARCRRASCGDIFRGR